MPTTTPLRATPLALAVSGPRRAALILLFALLIAALVGRTVFAFWEPPFDGTIRHDEIAPLGEVYWPMHLYLAGPAYAISFVGAALFLVLLARGRSAVLNLVGATLVAVCGIVFALVITSEALPFAYAADPNVMPEDEGRALFDLLNDNIHLLLPAIIGTQLAIALGMLLGLVGLLISRSTPRWFPIAALVYIVAFVALPPGALGTVGSAVLYLVEIALIAALGLFGLRAEWRRTL